MCIRDRGGTERMAPSGARAGGATRSARPAVPAVAGADSGILGRVAGAEAQHRHDSSDDPRSRRGGGAGRRGTRLGGSGPVSYTHLDVYKRQIRNNKSIRLEF